MGEHQVAHAVCVCVAYYEDDTKTSIHYKQEVVMQSTHVAVAKQDKATCSHLFDVIGQNGDYPGHIVELVQQLLFHLVCVRVCACVCVCVGKHLFSPGNRKN